MTDNIQKLYEIAGVDSVGFNTYTLKDEYPPFIAEKQLELIKWLLRQGHRFSVQYSYYDNKYGLIWYECADVECLNTDFTQTLAGFIYELWQDLSDDQKQEIKRILQ